MRKKKKNRKDNKSWAKYRDWFEPILLKKFKPNNKDRKTKVPKFATIDIETQDWINYVCGEVYWIDDNGKEYFYETDDISKLMLKCFEIAAKYEINDFVAHYGGKFDFLFFIKELVTSGRVTLENIIPRGSSLLCFDAILNSSSSLRVDYKLPQKITFRDSSALLPFGLGSLTKSFNVETLKGEMDFLFVEQVYKEIDYLDDILEHDKCVLFYKKKQIFSLTKNIRLRQDRLRYWNLERFNLFPYRGNISYVEPYMVKKNKKGEIIENDWFYDVTYPIFKKKDLLTYLHHDCKSLHQVITAFFNAPLICSSKKKWTTASQAVEVFRLFMDDDLHSLPDDDIFFHEGDVDGFVRQAYFGGRTEIFKPIFDNEINESEFLYYQDINSLYPFVMSKHEYPDKFLGWLEGEKEYNEHEMSIWHCKVRVPENMYAPPLPIKREERLIFPVGDFKGYWTKFELEYARSLGCEILEYYEGAAFSNAGPIFKNFIETLYKMRLEAKEKNDNVTQMTMKLLMNSCYGRMGINKERSKIIIDDGTFNKVKLIAEIDVNERYSIRLSEKPERSRTMFSNPAIACFVTSYARVFLHENMREVGVESVYYCDSVTKDRMVMIEDSKGLIDIVSFNDLWIRESLKSSIIKRGEKEIILTDLKTLSWNPDKKEMEVKPIKEIIRHRTNKKIYRVSSNKGISVVTEDHSFIDENNKRLKAEEVESLFSPKKEMAAIKINEIISVDMLEYIQNQEILDFKSDKEKSKSVLDFNDNWIFFKFLNSNNKDIPMIKRHWNKDELLIFMKYLAFFIGDGSTSTPHTTNSRYMWSINSEKEIELSGFKAFMESMTKNVSFNIIKSSKNDKTFKLASGTKLMAYFMRGLTGQTAGGKKLPRFVFNLSKQHKERFIEGLLIGDGSRITDEKFSLEYRMKNFTYCTKSFELANQLSVLFSMMGHCFSVQYRESKEAYTLVTSSKNRDKKPKIEEVEYDDYVYDLSVEGNENFFDCMGIIGLHNTDSLFTDKPMSVGKELGAMKLEYKCKSACFLLPKTYVNEEIIEEDGKEKPMKLTMKGFDYKNIRNAFTMDDFLEYLHGEASNISVIEKPKFATFKTALRMGEFVTMKNDPEINKTVDERREAEHLKRTGKKKKYLKKDYKVSVKKLQGYYTKRKIVKGGFDTEPLRLYE